MLTGTLDRRTVARAALSGLAFGVAVLACLALWGAMTTQRAVTGVRLESQRSSAWDDVLTSVSHEGEALNDYLRAPEDDTVEPLASTIGSAEPSLDWLAVHGAPGDRTQVAVVMAAYATSTTILRDVVAAGRSGSTARVDAEAAQAALNAASLRKQLTVAIQVGRIRLNAYLDQVRRGNQWLRRAMIVAVSLVLALLVLCGVLVLRYQRRIERHADRSRHQALHDVLTGLGNRSLLDEELTRAVAAAEATGGQVGLLLLDLNGFKGVNDTLGHHSGDLLLKRVAQRLTAAVRASDTVVRLGGDEFAVVLPDMPSEAVARGLAERFLTALQQPAELDGATVDVGGSIGVALCPAHSDGAQQLLQHADIAMYAAKRDQLGVAVYAPSMIGQTAADLSLLGGLRHAISGGELLLHYQPKIATRTGAVCGLEALVRWQHPQRGLLSPDEFIPMAEQAGLMGALTDHVLEVALAQVRRWRAQGWQLPVAVNIAPSCLLDSGFPARVAARLAAAEVPAGLVTLEITETALITDAETARTVLVRLRGLGVRLSIDDFGTGYSSMVYLTTMPVHELKIDKSFVSDMLTEPSKRVVVRAIVNLAGNLGLETVAEGVEDEATWAELATLDCAVAQGYHFSRPLPPVELEQWLAGRMPGPTGPGALTAAVSAA